MVKSFLTIKFSARWMLEVEISAEQVGDATALLTWHGVSWVWQCGESGCSFDIATGGKKKVKSHRKFRNSKVSWGFDDHFRRLLSQQTIDSSSTFSSQSSWQGEGWSVIAHRRVFYLESSVRRLIKRNCEKSFNLHLQRHQCTQSCRCCLWVNAEIPLFGYIAFIGRSSSSQWLGFREQEIMVSSPRTTFFPGLATRCQCCTMRTTLSRLVDWTCMVFGRKL